MTQIGNIIRGTMTIRQLYNISIQSLYECNIDFPQFEAKQIFNYIGEISAHMLIVDGQQEVFLQKETLILSCIKDRCDGIPLQYIIGVWEFFGREYKVGKGVLIPRADTEILVEKCISLLGSKKISSPIIYDLCSGSGCIAISLSESFPQSIVYAVELSLDAFKYLEANINNLSSGNLTGIKADIETFIPTQKADLIVSNPPYLTHNEMCHLQKEVSHEPSMALVADDNGLYFYNFISRKYKSYLNKGGILAFEVGYQQAESVRSILLENNYINVELTKDLSGVSRVVTGQLP